MGTKIIFFSQLHPVPPRLCFASPVREDSLSRIRAHIGQVDNRIRVVAWNSHARRTKTMEHVHELKLELDEAVEEHSRAETTMRHENLKLEAEVGDT